MINNKSILVAVLSLSIVSALFGSMASRKHIHTNEFSNSQLEKTVHQDFKISIPDYNKISQEEANENTKEVIEKQEEIQQLLLSQLKQNHLSNSAKTNIILLLGSMRVNKAVGILIENIDFKAKPTSKSNLPPTRIPVMSSPYVARSALRAIGKHASDAILYSIGAKPQDWKLFGKSKIDGYIEVLYDVNGPRYGLLKLQDHQQTATDPQVKAQYQMVIGRFKKVVAQTQ